jgi:malate permease and related proteins
LSYLLELFLNNLLPIFIIAGAGYLLGRWLFIDLRTLSQVVFYIFSPCLVFTLITGNRLNEGEILQMMGFATVIVILIGLLTWLIGKALRLERRMIMAMVLAAMFMNAGNYGLSVNLFAFGQEGLAQATLYFVAMGILTYTVGIMVASLGAASLRQSFMGLLRVPVVYGLALAFLFVRFDWVLPVPIDRAVVLLGNATVPTLLVLLGLQIRRVEWKNHIPAVAAVTGIRLLVSPLLAIGLSGLFGLQGVARQAGIMESAMPTAVMVTILANEYDIEPGFISTVVFASTLLSPLTITPLLAYLGG